MASELLDAGVTMRLLLASLLATSLVPACTTSDPPIDELDGESAADGEEGKGDTAAAFTFFDLRADLRQCSLDSGPDCGTGFFVARVNRSTTPCGDGVLDSECKVGDIDWSGTAMPASVAQRYEDGVTSGEPLLVRGAIVPSTNGTGATLAVTEIWNGSPASGAGYPDGVYTLVGDNGLQCSLGPCPNIVEQKLNSNVSPINIYKLDFHPSGADLDAINNAYNQFYSEDGIIIVGYRYTTESGHKGRTVNRFFTRAPVPLQ